MNAHMHRGSVYASTARFDTGRTLTEDEMRKAAPSIFASEAHSSRSLRFAPIPTIDVLRGLAKEGFHPVGVRQSTTRDPGKSDFTKHLIRLRRLDGEQHRVGNTLFEILLKNANDGSSAYDLLGGLFRIECLNSLVTQVDTFDTLKVRHSGDAIHKVIEGTYKVLGNAEIALTAPEKWAQIKLDRDEQRFLAEAAHGVRFGYATDGAAGAINPDRLLTARRVEDRLPDLWTQFNVVQENALRGGLAGQGRDANNRLRNYTTRPIKGIDADMKLNKALWLLGERMASLKASPAAVAA
jgi:hypothetical protein